MTSIPDCVDVLVTFKNGKTQLYEDILKVGVHVKEHNELHMTPGNGDEPFWIELEDVDHYEILTPTQNHE